MAISNLTLPSYVEPRLRLPVSMRHVGPVFAAIRRHSGYRFTIETDLNGETTGWLERAALRRR
jgi:hypothetical protein